MCARPSLSFRALRLEPQNPLGRLGERGDARVGLDAASFGVAAIDQYRRADLRPASGRDILPPVADDHAPPQIVHGRLRQQSGLRLPAPTRVAIVVIADPEL